MSIFLRIIAVLVCLNATTAFASFANIADIPSGKANIYVYRNGLGAVQSSIPVELDGNEVANTVGKSFVLLAVDPGRHVLASKLANEFKLELFVEAGKHYFVSQELVFGVPPGEIRLLAVDELEGRLAVLQSRQIALLGTNTSVVKTEQVDVPQSFVAQALAKVNVESPIVPPSEALPSAAALALAKVKVAPPKIDMVPFKLGISSVTVEKLARFQGCVGGTGANLVAGKGPIQVYRVYCDEGKVFVAKCEFRQCTALK